MSPLELLIHYAPRKEHWFHSFEVAPGVWSQGHTSAETIEWEMDHWGFPRDLTGKSVLDIGCADGGFSVAAMKHGARSVLAIDEQITTGMRLLQDAQTYPAIEFRQIELFSEAFLTLPQFDFVLFAGVLYHVQDMLEALKRLRRVAGGEVILETIFNERMGSSPPMAVFYEGDEANGDPTNWWGPNFACLEGMLRTAGFSAERLMVHRRTAEDLEGRVAYRLTPDAKSVFGSVIAHASGSNSLLEENIAALAAARAEIEALKARLG